ncbi:MAG: hypothetical protein ACHQ4H_15945, partial [Ktedonobacterales bacterium]
FVDRPADLAALVAELAHAHVVALDAEFAQSRYRVPDEPPHRLALLQLAFDNAYRASFVLDALRLADLSALQTIFEQPAILKVFHGIGADTRVLATRGLVAHNTLDIEAVSRSLFGQQESGLQRMLLRAAGVRIDKSLQRADWSRRPLTPAMVTYAARDAEMTYVLHDWLTAHYPQMVALHHTPAGEPTPAIAAWIVPYLEGSRPKPAAIAVVEAGLAADLAAQERDVRAALATVLHPPQRTRVIRMIADLELAGLTADLRPSLTAPAAEERSGAARAIGRLHDRTAILALRTLLADPVHDVRASALIAIEHLETGPRRPSPRPQPSTASSGSVRWTSDTESATTGGASWQDQLRREFGVSPPRLDAPDDSD